MAARTLKRIFICWLFPLVMATISIIFYYIFRTNIWIFAGIIILLIGGVALVCGIILQKKIKKEIVSLHSSIQHTIYKKLKILDILLYLNIPIGLIYAYWGMELVNQFSLEIENCSAVNINEIKIYQLNPIKLYKTLEKIKPNESRQIWLNFGFEVAYNYQAEISIGNKMSVVNIECCNKKLLIKDKDNFLYTTSAKSDIKIE